MDSNSFAVESPENFEQKCCCVLVLDVSGSMQGTPIDELNEGLSEFSKDILNDSTTTNRLEVAVVEFSDHVNTLVAPSLITNFTMPILTTKGTTKLVDGVNEGIRIARDRKAWYKQTGQPYYRPWVILITDGAPDADQNVTQLGMEIRKGMADKEFFFFAVGVQSADMAMLNSISDPSMTPGKLQGLKFSAFFKWLSASMTVVTNSKDDQQKVQLTSPTEWWEKGFTV